MRGLELSAPPLASWNGGGAGGRVGPKWPVS